MYIHNIGLLWYKKSVCGNNLFWIKLNQEFRPCPKTNDRRKPFASKCSENWLSTKVGRYVREVQSTRGHIRGERIYLSVRVVLARRPNFKFPVCLMSIRICKGLQKPPLEMPPHRGTVCNLWLVEILVKN